MYWGTRADDLIVKAMIGLLERNPNLPKERVDDVAIAATTQEGDQGLTLGRTAAILAGLPMSVPGYAIDRMCAGAMTAVATTAGGIAFGAYDVAIAGGVEHMGRHPMGGNADPNPRFLAEKLVSGDALNMGMTAERLHELAEVCDLEYLLVEHAHAGISQRLILRNLGLFATKVMPDFRDAGSPPAGSSSAAGC